MSVELFREVVGGSATGMDDRLREELPELLWLAYLGLVLFWVLRLVARTRPAPGSSSTPPCRCWSGCSA